LYVSFEEVSMPRCFTLPVAALGAALVLSCNDQPAPSEPRTIDSPSFRTEQNPTGPGAFVIHFEEGAVLFVDDDPAPGLTILLGWTLEELDLFCTTGDITIGAIKEVLVFRPDDSIVRQFHTKQVPLLIWESSSGDICALRQESHFTGTGHVNATDNDLETSGNRTNAAHNGFEGQVTSETGERFRLVGQWHAKIQKGSTEQVDRSEFRLIPVGP